MACWAWVACALGAGQWGACAQRAARLRALRAVPASSRHAAQQSRSGRAHAHPLTRAVRHVLTVNREGAHADVLFCELQQIITIKVLAVKLEMKTEHRTCCACGEPIADRFLLEVGGGAWHTACLRCCVCAVQLDRHPSCFLRDRQVYCKQDYAKSFGAKCSKCCRGISSSDWVRKAREQVYHLACFACDACGRQLSTGEQFALHEDRVLCKPHYLETLDGGSISSDDGCDSEGYHKSKAKRVRTTFTEEQLQVLQANFQLDSNPDGQDLERIAQVTGLSKRVTQVWFQNSRARQKKHQHTGKGKQSQLVSRDADPAGFGRPINLHLTYSFQNKPPFVPIDGTSFTDSSMDELSEDSSIHCMQSEV